MLQYSGAGHVDRDTGDVVLLCNRPGGGKVGVVVEGSCPSFFYMDVPESWKRQHIRAWADHLRDDRGWRMSHRVKLERRQQLMGYVPDPATGDPLKRRYLMFRFRSPNLMKDALRDLRKHARSYKDDLVRGFLQEHRDLFDYDEHWAPLWEAQLHMTDGRRFPALSKFQSLHGIVPMSWIRVAPGGAEESPPELVRNLPEVVRVDKVELVADEKQRTATRTLIAWDIETVSEYADDEDDTFPRPWRPGSHVINIGLRETKVPGTADTEGGDAEDTLTVRREVLVLGGTAPSGKCRIREFGTEPELLCYFLHNVLPRADVVVDYNGASFDWPYVFIRLQLFLFFGGLAVGGEARILRRYRRARQLRFAYMALTRRFLDAGRSGAFCPAEKEALYLEALALLGRGEPRDFLVRRFVESGDRLPAPEPEDLLLSLYETEAEVLRAHQYFSSAPCPPDALDRVGHFGFGFKPSYKWFKDPLCARTDCREPSGALQFRGVFVLDMMQVSKKILTLERYGLDQVAKHLGQGGKDDSFGFDYNKMFQMWRGGNPEERRVVAEYCMVDVDILVGVFNALQMMQRMAQTAFAARVALHKTCGGMQALVWPLIFDAAYRDLGLMPNLQVHVKKQKYEGAIVLDPASGLYRPWDEESKAWSANATLDFASLYPSCMIADNICYTTYVEKRDHARVRADKRIEVVEFTDPNDPEGVSLFVQAPGLDSRRAGLVPRLEAELKTRRTATRKIKKAVDKRLKDAPPGQRTRLRNESNNLEQMQLAMKLIMNSIYGFFGAPGDFATCPQVHAASAITESGRRSILRTRDMCLAMTAARLLKHLDEDSLDLSQEAADLVRQVLGWNPDLKIGVVGGDTDSVFLRLRLRLRCAECGGARACERCYGGLYHRAMWAMGEALAAVATDVTFARKPSMILEMEKYFSIEAVIVKKKYIGRVHYDDSGKSKVGGKGTLVVRGDTIGLVKKVYEQLCDVLLDPRFERLQAPVEEDALAVAHQAFEDMLEGKFPGELYMQRKKLSRAPHKYKRTPLKDGGGFRPLPQWVQVAAQILERTGKPVEVGSYVRWLVTRNARGEQGFVDSAHWISAPEHERDPLDMELYMSRVEIVGELLQSFLGPDVFRFLTKHYIDAHKSKLAQKGHEKKQASILSFLPAARKDKAAVRARVLRKARAQARKSQLLKKKLARTRAQQC